MAAARKKTAGRPAGYSGTPLPKKLGIKEGFTVGLVGAPPGFDATLGALPDGASLRRRAAAGRDLTIWFVRTRRDLEKGIERLAGLAGEAGLWIAWPKKASGVETDVTGNEVRRAGLGAGLVDFKVCAVDETWSGLKFVRRRGKSGGAKAAKSTTPRR